MAKGKPGKLKCAKCGRTFSMPAHLARHKNAVHGVKTQAKAKVAKKRVAKRAVRKIVKRRATRTQQPAAFRPMPLLQQMRAYRGELVAQHAELDSQITAIATALAALGAAPGTATTKPGPRKSTAKSGPRRRGRGPRPGSLKSYVERVLRGRSSPMAVKNVATAVVRAGFKTQNKALAKSVGIAMTQMPNVIKVSRGMFRLK